MTPKAALLMMVLSFSILVIYFPDYGQLKKISCNRWTLVEFKQTKEKALSHSIMSHVLYIIRLVKY